MEKQLTLVRRLQLNDPSLILGGSLGLYLQGIDLGRDLSKSDLDLTCSGPLPEYLARLSIGAPFESADMDKQLVIDGISIQVQTNTDVKYIAIFHEWKLYRVRPVLDILKWKIEYCNKYGNVKHQTDLITLGLSDLIKNPITAI